MTIVAISRGSFSGGMILANCVAERLGYRCLARMDLAKVANRYGVSEEQISKAISETPGLLEHLRSERVRYMACAKAALVSEVTDERVVYHGLAGHFLLQEAPHVLSIRVIANMEYRIKEVMERRDLTREDAVQIIKTVDEKRSRWTKFLYNVDWSDPSLYDIVINLNNISISSACEVVSLAASLPKLQATRESQRKLKDLALATELKALIMAGKHISSTNVEIDVDEGIVTLSGKANSLEEADQIREIIMSTPGVKEINSMMRVRTPMV